MGTECLGRMLKPGATKVWRGRAAMLERPLRVTRLAWVFHWDGSLGVQLKSVGCVLQRCFLVCLFRKLKGAPSQQSDYQSVPNFPLLKEKPFSWFVWISATTCQTFMHTPELWGLKWIKLPWTMAYMNPIPRLRGYLYVHSHSLTIKTCITPWFLIFCLGFVKKTRQFSRLLYRLWLHIIFWRESNKPTIEFDCFPSYNPHVYICIQSFTRDFPASSVWLPGGIANYHFLTYCG